MSNNLLFEDKMRSVVDLPKSNSNDDIERAGFKAAGVASAVMFARIASIAIAGIAFIVVSRILGPSIYGLYIIAASIAGIFTSFADLGTSTAFSKFGSEYKSKKRHDMVSEMISNGYGVVILFGIVLTIALFASSSYISKISFGTIQYTYLVEWIAATILVTVLFNMSTSILIGLGRSVELVKSVFLQVSIQGIVGVAFAFLGFGAMAPILGLLAGFSIGTIIATYYAYHSEGMSISMPHISSIKRLLKFSIPISIAGAVGGVASSISPILLGRFTSSAIVGNVGVSIRTGNIIGLAVDSAGASLLPFFSTINSVGSAKVSANNISRAFNYSIYIILMLFLPSSVFFAVLSKDISRVLFGSSYIMAPYYISIVSIGIIISMLASYTSTLLISSEKVVKVMKYTILVSIAEVILLLLLVKSIGGFALILSLSVVGPLISLALYMHIAISEVKIKLSADKSLRVVLAAFISALVIIPIALYFSHGTLYGSITAMALGFIAILIVYPPLIAVLKGIEQKDIDRIKLIGKEIPIAGSFLSIIAAYVEHFAAR